VRALEWAGPNHLIVVSSRTAEITDVIAPRREYLMAFDYNLTTQKLHPLLRDADYSLNTIYDEPEVREIGGKPVLFLQGVHFKNRQGVLSVFRVDLENDSSKLVEEGDVDTRHWVIGVDGKAIAQSL